jgi:tRNA 2-thiouridine synthesizing protein C
MKKIVYLVRTAPYGSSGIPESVRGCLGFATLPFDLHYILMDDAAWALLPAQQPEAIGGTDTWKLFEGLADLDVSLYVEAEALAERGLAVSGDGPPFKTLSDAEISALIGEADAVLTF